jgi:hypothetical protein
MLGLVQPRFLLRLPYGENTRSIDRFSYEEFSAAEKAQVYLWGNPALASAALLAQAFLKNGWGFKPGMVMDLGDMPLHVFTGEDGDSEATLTEMWLTAAAAQKAAKLGFMTLLPVRGRDSVQLAHFHALAEGAAGLPGRWEKGAGVPRPVSAREPTVSVSVSPVGGPAPEAPPPPASEAPPSEEAPAAGGEESSPESAEVPATADPGMDPEAAALLNQTAETPPAEDPAAATAADAGLDPEMAALLKQMDEGGSPAAEPSAEPPGQAAEPAAPEMDPELAALLKQLEEGPKE